MFIKDNVKIYIYRLYNKVFVYNLRVWHSISVNLKNNPVPIRYLIPTNQVNLVLIWTDATTFGGVDSLGNGINIIIRI